MRVGAVGCAIVAWLMFVASFALPAAPKVTGWEFAISVWMSVAWAAFMLIMGAGPGALLWALGVSLANGFMLLSPVFIFSSRGNAWMMAPILIVSGILPWLCPTGLRSDVLFGYLIWNASFFLMAIGSLLVTAAEDRARRMLITTRITDMESEQLAKNCTPQSHDDAESS